MLHNHLISPLLLTSLLVGWLPVAQAAPSTTTAVTPTLPLSQGAQSRDTGLNNNLNNSPNNSFDEPMDDIEEESEESNDTQAGAEADIANPASAAVISSPTSNNLPTSQVTKMPVTTGTPTTTINPEILRAADNVPPTLEQVPLGAISPATIQKFVKLIDTVRQEYVRPVNDEQLFDNAMTGVLAGLDPYSEYLNPEAYNNLRLFTEGDMGSIGVKAKFDPISQQWVFSEILPNSPASKAGIKVGDYLHQINDNKLLDSQTQQDVEQLLSGIAGTQVKLVISNQGRRKHNVMLQRSLVQPQAIDAKIINGIAIVHIPIFQSNTQQQFINALTKINRPFNAIILDLRNNPGGVLTAATDIASLFMQDKNVVQVHNRQGLQEIVKTRATPRLATIPLVVLQNRYSASASEVLASSLQENGRAKIFGETSYGKGSIQSVIPLIANDAVKLTVAHYYSGNGKKIDGIGVTPDTFLAGGELTWEDQAINYMLLQPRPTRYILKN